MPLSLNYYMLGTLIRLRYQLLWAHSRSKNGRIALLLAGYILGALVFLFFNFGGQAVAVAGVKLGHGEEIARLILSSLFVSGIFTSLALGVGPRLAFSEQVLRRYPLSTAGRFAARHLIGLLDVMWLLLLATALGLAIGFDVLDAGSIFIGVPAALLFIIATYLTAMIVLSLIDRAIQYKGGTTILSTAAFGLLIFASVAVPVLLTRYHFGWPHGLDLALRWTPPGIAAALLVAKAAGTAVALAVTLLGWCVVLGFILRGLERQSPVSQSAGSTAIRWDNRYDRLANLFGRKYAPMVGKALRYHLRSSRVRFTLAITVPIVALVITKMGRGIEPHGIFLIALALFFWAGAASTNVITLNQFGYDGAGVRRYALLPVPFVASVRAASFVSLLIGGLITLPALLLWALFFGPVYEARMWLMLLVSGIAGLFFFNSLGLWTTILAPRRIDFRSIMGNQLSIAGNLILIGGFALVLGTAFVLMKHSNLITVMGYWWVLLLLSAVCLGLYVMSLSLVANVSDAHRERIIKAIAGASNN